MTATTTTDGNGSYTFWVLAGGPYTIVPKLSGYSFSPASQTFGAVNAARTGNFAAGSVQISNLTHPTYSPNFVVGDTFQVTVLGAPNQAVYRSRSLNGNSSTVQIGVTNAAGSLQLTGPENTTGTYTDVYSVGSSQVGSAITYVTAATGGVGAIVTEDLGQTANGLITGLSYLSIDNNAVSTYSQTSLSYSASADYDTTSVVTLYQDGQAIKSGLVNGTISAAGSLTTTAVQPWSDYTLQTDHYVVAFLPVTGGYSNPDYFGDGSCDEASSDCSIGIGIGPLVVLAETIYVGSTVADQTAISNFSMFPSVSDLPPGIARTTGMVNKFAIMIGAVATALLEASNLGNDVTDPPVPALVQLIDPNLPEAVAPDPPGDSYQPDSTYLNGAKRDRRYIVKDSYGRVWLPSRPLLITESFERVSSGGSLPPADGQWTSSASHSQFPAGQVFGSDGSMQDFYGLGVFAASVQYNQYYSATISGLPSWWNFPPAQTAAWPLIILDAWNTCLHGTGTGQYPRWQPLPLPGQTIYLTRTGIGVDGDSGPPTKYQGNPAHNGCGNPTFP